MSIDLQDSNHLSVKKIIGKKQHLLNLDMAKGANFGGSMTERPKGG